MGNLNCECVKYNRPNEVVVEVDNKINDSLFEQNNESSLINAKTGFHYDKDINKKHDLKISVDETINKENNKKNEIKLADIDLDYFNKDNIVNGQNK